MYFVVPVLPSLWFTPTPRFRASLTDTLVRSLDPGEVDPATGITVGRFASTRNTVTPAVSYQLTPLTHLRLQYSFSTLRSDSPLAEVTTSLGLTATVSLSAARAVTVALEGGVRATETAGTAADFLVYMAGTRLDYRNLQWLSVNAGYPYLRQDDRTGPLDQGRPSLPIGHFPPSVQGFPLLQFQGLPDWRPRPEGG